MSRAPRRPRDTNQLAKLIVDLSVGEAQEASQKPRSRASRSKGGKARMRAMSAKQRSEFARRAAAKRWKKPAPSRKGAG